MPRLDTRIFERIYRLYLISFIRQVAGRLAEICAVPALLVYLIYALIRKLLMTLPHDIGAINNTKRQKHKSLIQQLPEYRQAAFE